MQVKLILLPVLRPGGVSVVKSGNRFTELDFLPICWSVYALLFVCFLCLRLLGLPACLLYARDLALVSEVTEADTADTELTEISVRASADLAAVVLSGGELLSLLLLVNHSFLCHRLLPPDYFAKGAPKSLSSSRASSSVFAVVTKQMSIPRIFSTLSYSISGKISCSFRPRA